MLAAETEAAETQTAPTQSSRADVGRGLDGEGGSLRCAAHQVGEIAAHVKYTCDGPCVPTARDALGSPSNATLTRPGYCAHRREFLASCFRNVERDGETVTQHQHPMGADGFRVRPSGEYARRKLDFLREFLSVALNVARSKRDRVYIDLFAGSGVNRSRTTGRVFDGSPLVAIRARGLGTHGRRFTEAHFIESCGPCQESLEARVDALCAGGELMPRAAVTIHVGDANALLPQLLERWHPLAYIFVHADLEGPEDMPWTTVQMLKGKGHKSVDLYVLYPVGGINRLLPYKDVDANADLLDKFFGNHEWAAVVRDKRPTSRQMGVEGALLNLYRRGLKSDGLWQEVVDAESAGLGSRRELYRMLYATSNKTAQAVAAHIAARRRDAGQRDLFK
jgi:three-Cys-motif partner protein